MIEFSDYTLGVTIENFSSEEHRYLYSFISEKGNILSGGKKQIRLNFFEKLCNYMMKQGRNTGKKQLCFSLLLKILEKLDLEFPGKARTILLTAIFNGMPFRTVRRERRGSGKITRAVYLSPSRKIVFALSVLTKDLASKRKRNKSYVDCFVKEISSAYKKESTSILVMRRKESEAAAESSNY